MGTNRVYFKKSDMPTGHVYLITPMKAPKAWTKGIEKWPFKIGVSKSVKGVYKRLGALSTGNWIELTVANISPQIFLPYDVELFLHNNYSKNKIKGEWFNLSYDEFYYIVDLLEKEPDEESMRHYGAFMKEWGYDYSI